MILKIRGQLMEQNNVVNVHCKCAISTLNSTHPLMLLMLMFSFLCS